jgi:hypothetical protein
MTRTRVVLFAAVAVGALASATAAYSTFAGGGPSPDPFVAGGGLLTAPLTTRDFSVDSHIEKRGSVVYGTLRYGRNGNAMESPNDVDVTCVGIEGNRAIVGGVQRANPTEGWAIFLVDNGPPGGTTDQASFAFVDPVGTLPGFPASCPSFADGISFYDASLFDVTAGDVIVSAGSD